MKIKCISLLLAVCIPVCFANDIKPQIQDEIRMTRFFQSVAITSVSSYGPEGNFAGYKLLVRPVIYNKDHFVPFRHTSNKPAHELGKPFWVITGNQLPATEDTCITADADSCDSDPADPYNVCYNSCIKYGPEFLYFNKDKNDLYILAPTEDVGQAGGKMLVYVANIQTKTIKFVKSIYGYVSATMSPSSRYIAFDGSAVITIHNLETKEDIEITKDNQWEGKRRLHSLSVISWLNDTQFVYRDNIYHSKFQKGWDEATEYVYDITVRKNIKTRLLKKSEYPMKGDDNNSANVPLI